MCVVSEKLSSNSPSFVTRVPLGRAGTVDKRIGNSAGRVPYFAHQNREHPGSRLAMELNRCHLRIAELVAPSLSDDVENHAAYWSAVLGMSRYLVGKYAEIGMMLRRMPRLATSLGETGAIPLGHISMMAQHVRVVSDETVTAIETDLLPIVNASRSGEALRGVRSMRNRVQRVIDEHDPDARPRDVEVVEPRSLCEMPRELADMLASAGVQFGGDKSDGGEQDECSDAQLSDEQEELRRRVVDFFGDCATERESFHVDERPESEMVAISVELERPHAVELLAIVDAVAEKRQVNRAEALLSAVRGDAQVSVNLDLYRVLTLAEGKAESDTPLWLAGAGWLSPMASEGWLERVSSLRVLGESRAEGYVPTDSQKAFVRARDGIRRFPGCDVPAEKCEIDHVVAYCHEDPGSGPGTVTSNLQCLCKRHHDLKTAALWSARALSDGTVVWQQNSDFENSNAASLDNVSTGAVHRECETFASVPEGPFAQAAPAGSERPRIPFGRYTFNQQTVQKTGTLKEHNERRRKRDKDLHDLVVAAREVARGMAKELKTDQELNKTDQELNGESGDIPPF